MFDLGWSEMMIVGVLALIIIGPKDLPRVFKQLSYWIKQLRGMASEFQSGIDEMVKEADLEDAKKVFDGAKEFNPRNQLKKLVDPNDDLKKDLDIESEFSNHFSDDESMLFEEQSIDELAPAQKAKTTRKPKTTTAKKTAAKTTSTKATTKKTATATKTVAKKPSVKKPAAKATTAKKPTNKKTLAKKEAAKPTAKKASASKTSKPAKSES